MGLRCLLKTNPLLYKLSHDGGPYHIETSSANQWTGYYMFYYVFSIFDRRILLLQILISNRRQKLLNNRKQNSRTRFCTLGRIMEREESYSLRYVGSVVPFLWCLHISSCKFRISANLLSILRTNFKKFYFLKYDQILLM